MVAPWVIRDVWLLLQIFVPNQNNVYIDSVFITVRVYIFLVQQNGEFTKLIIKLLLAFAITTVSQGLRLSVNGNGSRILLLLTYFFAVVNFLIYLQFSFAKKHLSFWHFSTTYLEPESISMVSFFAIKSICAELIQKLANHRFGNHAFLRPLQVRL